ncbi:hypothetical protein QBC43DRAFT_213966 [Cladorrhinum sp. PSN259]|nr:hypothetical protein QBC43DRAFT_213966 [Cladorrhinum sp. PSN259]
MRFSCPSGGNFYICQHNTTEFLGCCTTDPCADGHGICPLENLRPASFPPNLFNDILPQTCADKGPNIWYICNSTLPPFIGCCRNNPCHRFCAQSDLVPAILSSNSTARSVFLPTAPSPSPPFNGSMPTPSNLPPSEPSILACSKAPKLPVPVIIGISVGVGVFIAICAILFYIWRRYTGRNVPSAHEKGEGGIQKTAKEANPVLSHASIKKDIRTYIPETSHVYELPDNS